MGFRCVGSALLSECFLFRPPMSEVAIFTHVLFFDGKASSFLNYEGKVISRNRIFTRGPQRRAAIFIAAYDRHCAGSLRDGRQGSY